MPSLRVLQELREIRSATAELHLVVSTAVLYSRDYSVPDNVSDNYLGPKRKPIVWSYPDNMDCIQWKRRYSHDYKLMHCERCIYARGDHAECCPEGIFWREMRKLIFEYSLIDPRLMPRLRKT